MKLTSIPKTDLLKIISNFNRRITLLFVFVVALYFDSNHFAEIFTYNQYFINFFMILAFVILYKRSVKRTRELMLYAVIIGFIGEYFFSVYLGMYTYRLENVPLYVPFGHAAVYARVFAFSKTAVVRNHHQKIEQFFYLIISLFAISYWVLFNDFFGFIMTLGVFALLLKRPKDRMYFLTMYITVAVLEIGGTAYGAWYWPDTAFGVFDYLPSNNPPSGISLFYFLLDIGCFVVYILVNNKAWKRVRNIRKIQKLKSHG